MRRAIQALWAILALAPVTAVAHPGATDAKGGHTDRRTGQYHLHGASSTRANTAGPLPSGWPAPRPQNLQPVGATIHFSPPPQRLPPPPLLVAPAEPTKPGNGIQVVESSGVYDERRTLLEYQQRLAARGNPEAQYAMGIRFLEGIDVVKSEEEALAYLRASARNGNLRAQAKLREISAEKRRAAERSKLEAEENFLRSYAERKSNNQDSSLP